MTRATIFLLISTRWAFDQPQPAEVRGEIRDSTTRTGSSHLCRAEMDWTQRLSRLPFEFGAPMGTFAVAARRQSMLEYVACFHPKRPQPAEVNHRQPKEQWHRDLLFLGQTRDHLIHLMIRRAIETDSVGNKTPRPGSRVGAHPCVLGYCRSKDRTLSTTFFATARLGQCRPWRGQESAATKEYKDRVARERGPPCVSSGGAVLRRPVRAKLTVPSQQQTAPLDVV